MSIKPFYVYKPTREESIEIVERAFANGADCEHAVTGMNIEPSDEFCDYNKCKYWGVDSENQIAQWVYDYDYGKSASNLTMEEVRAMLPCEKYDRVKWNGEGLPPAGVVCEIKGTQTGCWSVGSIRYIDNRHCVWEWRSGNSGTMHNTVSNMQFRQIRTKREKWIDKAIMFFYEDSEKTRVILGEIYDSGLAKDIEE